MAPYFFLIEWHATDTLFVGCYCEMLHVELHAELFKVAFAP